MKLWVSASGIMLLAVAGFQAWHNREWIIFAIGGFVLVEIWYGIGIVVREIRKLKAGREVAGCRLVSGVRLDVK